MKQFNEHALLRSLYPCTQRYVLANGSHNAFVPSIQMRHICLYGLYALLNADHLLEETIDAAIGGEYEVPLLNLVHALEKEGEPVLFLECARAKSTAGRGYSVRHLLCLNVNRYHHLARYARLEWGEEWRVVGYTEATRGCKHTCLHCPITPIYSGRFFAVPVDIVLADIRTQVKRGARHITFGDPDFFNGPTHALRIARALHQEFP